MPQISCGIFPIGRGVLKLWPLVPETARTNEYFVVLAAPSNMDLVSLNGKLMLPGTQELMLRGELKKASVCGPDPSCQLQIFAVVEGR
jgi:hypothetical protein